jgi:thymidine phosphorylase
MEADGPAKAQGGPLPQEIIRRKRDGGRLSGAEIDAFVRGLTDGSVGDGQAAAFAMAVYFNGMDWEERVALTRAMAGSGDRVDWSGAGVAGPRIDKHSTGGVGDKVSLILAPLAAACGLAVPMISGRGLGHTGGTTDKMESIPGYDATPSLARFRQVVAEAGCAIIGQTAELVPADRRLYGIRDVTATVESIPLITASILAKKLAAGLDGLVMDVKTGNGAFMADEAQARELAESLVAVATGAGLPTAALVTDMDQVLGRTAGNALEVAETVDFLTGKTREARLAEVTLALGVEMLRLGRVETDEAAARALLLAALDDGRAAERFARMVAALGGPADMLEHAARHLPAAPVVAPAAPSRAGVVQRIDVRAVGLAVVALGGGRTRPGQEIDSRVGLSAVAGIGERVGPARPLALVHAADGAAATRAVATLQAAFEIGDGDVAVPPVLRARIGA